MKKLITAPFNALKRALKRVEYILTIRHKVHTVYILLILLHWIYGYAFITGTQFYEGYINEAQARTNGSVGILSSEYTPGDDNSDIRAVEESRTPGTEAWIRQQWEAAGADWNEVWAVVQGESSWNSDAMNFNTNGSYDAGLYQLNSIHKIPLSCAINTVCSTHEAIAMWRTQGWTPWVAAIKLGIK